MIKTHEALSNLRIEKREVPENTLRIALAFLRQKYPLSDAGQQLYSEVSQALVDDDQSLEELKDRLPTVENPNLDLFDNLDLSLDEQIEYFGMNGLGTIQVSKGCFHQCKHCCFASGQKVEIMPYAAVLKTAEVTHQMEERASESFRDWKSTLSDVVGPVFGVFMNLKEHPKYNSLSEEDITYFQNIFWRELSRKFGSGEKTMKEIFDLYNKHEISRHYPLTPKYYDDISNFLETEFEPGYQKVCEALYAFDRPNFKDISIMNYYDSDVFSYRDPNFRHEDGSSADYADVFKATATENRPIHITTAGWFLNDRTAQRAAQKLVEYVAQNRDMLATIRISISPYERVAVQDFDAYLEMMKNVIFTLRDLNPQVIFEIDREMNSAQAQEYHNKVLKPLRVFIDNLNQDRQGKDYWNRVTIDHFWEISRYSGRMASAEGIDDPDVGAPTDEEGLVPYIIEPNGHILVEKYNLKGQRPESTGKQSYHLKK